MKSKVITRPITDLRNTNEISKQCHNSNEPIFITKNGYDDLVIMSNETYNTINKIKDDSTKQSLCYNMVKVACATNDINVACVSENVNNIIKIIEANKENDLDILVFPELSVSGYSCGDLFYFSSLLEKVNSGIETIRKATINNHTLIFVGAPLLYKDKLYNCAVAISDGEILGIIPKSYLPNYNEFYENRQFVQYHGKNTSVILNGKEYPFGTKLLFVNKHFLKLKVACELCEDLWSVNTPSSSHVLAGANVIVNLSASNELYGKDIERRNLITSTSTRLTCAYLYSCVGNGESSSDLIYAGHNIIAENGTILKESRFFSNETIISEIDLDIIASSRRKSSSFDNIKDDDYQIIYFSKKMKVNKQLTREISTAPFVNKYNDVNYALSIIKLQAMGLVKRLKHINCKNVVLGLSGGLDSTLALIVCYEAFKYLNYDFKNIHTITMPCFGTTNRTYNNALKLSELFNTSLYNISIKEAVKQHLKDINHELKDDITFENAQARERTQVLFDFANKVNGIVIGTGDLSELALGWCTYNGDQMSSYCVNGSVPKTLVQFLVNKYGEINHKFKDVLTDILNTPISPELINNNENSITQVTEDIIGPYELHDFFLYHLMKYNFAFEKIYYYSYNAFKDKYEKEEIKKWLNVFIKRFFNNQFKRSSMPDGPKVTEISLSPRGDLRMPSDASYLDFIIK